MVDPIATLHCKVLAIREESRERQALFANSGKPQWAYDEQKIGRALDMVIALFRKEPVVEPVTDSFATAEHKDLKELAILRSRQARECLRRATDGSGDSVNHEYYQLQTIKRFVELTEAMTCMLELQEVPGE